MAGPSPAKRTPRRTARAAAPTRPRVVLNLDTLDKATAFPNAKIPKAPFTFLLVGHEYELLDPRDADWKLALQLARNPFLRMRTSLVDADEPIDDPTEDEIRACRDRHALPEDPPAPGTPEAEQEAKDWPDGVTPALIDRFTAAPMPSWKLNALFGGWHEHYGIDLTAADGVLAALLGKSE